MINNEYYLDKDDYSKIQTWSQKFPDKKVSLKEPKIDKSWKKLFDRLFENKKFKKVEEELSEEVESVKNILMYPKPDLVFNAFNLTSFKKLKVVFIGQDPYFDHEVYNKHFIPQAMGLAFSVPIGIKTPSSLKNIYANQKKFGHIKEIPTHGNLEYWAEQGCLMLNTSLTVKDGTCFKNCHQSIWRWFTDEIIEYISENKDNVIFVLWGSHALDKKKLIDEKKHTVIVSSHPSGLSVGKPLKEYSAFNAEDHFGKINKQLKAWKLDEIDWSV